MNLDQLLRLPKPRPCECQPQAPFGVDSTGRCICCDGTVTR